MRDQRQDHANAVDKSFSLPAPQQCHACWLNPNLPVTGPSSQPHTKLPDTGHACSAFCPLALQFLSYGVLHTVSLSTLMFMDVVASHSTRRSKRKATCGSHVFCAKPLLDLANIRHTIPTRPNAFCKINTNRCVTNCHPTTRKQFSDLLQLVHIFVVTIKNLDLLKRHGPIPKKGKLNPFT